MYELTWIRDAIHLVHSQNGKTLSIRPLGDNILANITDGEITDIEENIGRNLDLKREVVNEAG